MNEEIIRKYADLMKELELTGLEITENETKIRLERTACTAPLMQTAAYVPTEQDQEKPAEKGFDKVISPMVGIFYAAPAENADTFVKVGDHVQKGQTLCIIEAMKLMNEVSADRDGVIKEICVNNGDAVEYGTVLFMMGE